MVSPDANEIAPGSVRRIEVLRDGASAIYGADAVAGVINTHLKGNLTGGFVEGDFRLSDGTSLYNYTLSGGFGFDFGGGRGNLTLYGSYFHESGLPVTGRDYARDDNRLPLVVGTDFEGDASFNNRNTFGPFGQFDIQAADQPHADRRRRFLPPAEHVHRLPARFPQRHLRAQRRDAGRGGPLQHAVRQQPDQQEGPLQRDRAVQLRADRQRRGLLRR